MEDRYCFIQNKEKAQLSHLQRMIDLIDLVLEKMIIQITKGNTNNENCFFPKEISPYLDINFKAFVHTLLKNEIFDVSCLVYSLDLVDKLVKSGFTLTKTNKLFVFYISLIISQKMIEDDRVSYKQLGEIILMPVCFLEAMEYEFLERISYSAFLSDEMYHRYLKFLYVSSL